MGTRGRLVLELMGLAWVGVMIAIWLTAPRHQGGPYTVGMAAHIYAEPSVFLVGLAGIPRGFWLADGRQRGRQELRWRLIAVLGALLAVAIGAAGIRAVVHPPYAQTTCVPHRTTGRPTCTHHSSRADGTLAEYGLAALAVVLLTGLATARTAPPSPASEPSAPPPTTSRAR